MTPHGTTTFAKLGWTIHLNYGTASKVDPTTQEEQQKPLTWLADNVDQLLAERQRLNNLAYARKLGAKIPQNYAGDIKFSKPSGGRITWQFVAQESM